MQQLKIKLPILDKLQNKPLSCGDEDKLQLSNSRIHCTEKRKVINSGYAYKILHLFL